MTQEEKAKRYDEALHKAKNYYSTTDSSSDIKLIGLIFPELKESEDERIMGNIIATIHLYYGEPLEDEAKEMIAWLEAQGEKGAKGNDREIPNSEPPLTIKHAREVMGIKQDTAWSEEDEMFVHGLIRGLAAMKNIHGHTTFSSDNIDITKTIDWLKNLKGRVGCEVSCTATKEWSEEDDVKINRIVACLENLNVADNDILLKDVAWLKSLKGRCTWKPSDEQIIELRRVISGCSYDIEPLAEMEEQLKKLREE